MSNLHAAGLPQLNIIDIPVAHLVAGQQIRYHRSEWTVADVLPGGAALLQPGSHRRGDRAVNFQDLDLDQIQALFDDGPQPGCNCEDCADENDIAAWQSELDGGL